MLLQTVDHLVSHVLPAADEYAAAEQGLTAAFALNSDPASWEPTGTTALRKAAELAVAIDGLTDRCAGESGLTKDTIRQRVSMLCVWPGSLAPRIEALERIRGVANAYKHFTLSDPRLPINSWSDVLVIGPGWGIDAWGVGKYSGIETIVKDKVGKSWKFLADAPVAVSAWFRYLGGQGATLPGEPIMACGVQVHP